MLTLMQINIKLRKHKTKSTLVRNTEFFQVMRLYVVKFKSITKCIVSFPKKF